MSQWKPLPPTVISLNVGKQSIYFPRFQGTEIEIPVAQYAVFNVLPDSNLKQAADIYNSKPTAKTRLDLCIHSRRHKEGKRKWPSFAAYFRGGLASISMRGSFNPSIVSA
jgi:hypothetical protein